MGQRQHRSYHVKLRTNSADVREESIRGQEYVIVPVVMLVEGVIQGALAETPELALASEFGSNPTAWNGCPVPVAHPRRNEQFVSAGSPDVWGVEVIGFLFNTALVEKSLCSEIWINKTWAEESEYSDVLKALQGGEVMEVSTGLFADMVDVQGVWSGKTYRGMWTNVVPDHLALLPNDTGACSVAMGAGTNRSPIVNSGLSDKEYSDLFSAARLQAQTHNAQRLSAINQISKEISMPAPAKKTSTPAPSFFQRVLAAISPKTDEPALSAFEQQIRTNLQGISDNDLRTAMAAALAAASESYCCVIAVFDDRVVYEALDENYNWVMVQRGYTIDSNGAGRVNLDADIVQVRPMTSFVPVTTNATEESEMSTSQAAPAPKANEEGGAAASEVTTPAAVTEIPAAAVTEPVVPAAVTEPVMNKSSAAALFGADEATITEALAARVQQKEELSARILAAPDCSFTKEELAGFSLQQLHKMCAMVTKPAAVEAAGSVSVNFAGAAGSPQLRDNAGPVAIVKAFPGKSKAA